MNKKKKLRRQLGPSLNRHGTRFSVKVMTSATAAGSRRYDAGLRTPDTGQEHVVGTPRRPLPLEKTQPALAQLEPLRQGNHCGRYCSTGLRWLW
jgi:hypothetical protein